MKFRMTLDTNTETEARAVKALISQCLGLEACIEVVEPARMYHKYEVTPCPTGVLPPKGRKITHYERCWRCGTVCAVHSRGRLFLHNGEWQLRVPCSIP